MSELATLLLIAVVSISVYAKARREETWSWLLFAKTILGALAIIAAETVLVIFQIRWMGPGHAVVATLCSLLFIIAGVVMLAIWVRLRPPDTDDEKKKKK